MNLLLLSNSSSDAGYLTHALPWIRETLTGAERAAFVPYAGVTVSWDDYAAKARDALADIPAAPEPHAAAPSPIEEVPPPVVPQPTVSLVDLDPEPFTMPEPAGVPEPLAAPATASADEFLPFSSDLSPASPVMEPMEGFPAPEIPETSPSVEPPTPAPLESQAAAEPAETPATTEFETTPIAPEPAPAIVPEGAEDLTVIATIDEEVQRRLYEAGVRTLEEIAQWGRGDARRMSTAVEVSEDTIMNQWVFEAQSALFQRYTRQSIH